jgi:tetratricopeptide (TPR) repeat protein
MPAPEPVTHSNANVEPNATPGDGADATQTAVAPTGTLRYALGGEIARGGMGVIYRATDATLGREVAVKVLQEKYCPESGAARRFADEARIAGQLQHPAIPPVHDLGILPDGRPFLAMKLIKGHTLKVLLGARLDPAHEQGRFVAVFEQVCQGLAYAHAHGVIHRDLKPANIMVGAFGEVQVMDWGLAKVLGARPPGASADPIETTGGTEVRSLREDDGSLTQAGSVLGTLAFMPPEQAVGAVGKVDMRSDVFGLGAILAVVLTGQPPFAASSGETLRIQAAQGKVDDCFARLDASGADPGLVALCKACLAPNQADRPADGGAVAVAVARLRQAADERARRAEIDRVRAEAERAKADAQTREQRKRRWIQAALGSTFTAAVVLAGVGLWWAERRDAEQQAEQARVEAERTADQAAAVARSRQAANAAAVLVADLYTQFRYAEAVKAIDQAAELIPPGGPADIRAGLDRARADTLLLRDLDEIRFSRIRASPHQKVRDMPQAFRAAFRARGIDPCGPDQAAADWVLASPVRAYLSVALTDWARDEPDKQSQDRLLAIARQADPGPWGDRIRNQASWQDQAALRLAADAPVAELPPHQLVMLLQIVKGPWPGSRAVLEEAASRYPNHFWLQFELGYNFTIKDRDPARAIGYLRAALALRPDAQYPRMCLAWCCRDTGDLAGAEACFRQVVRDAPDYAEGHLCLGEALTKRKLWDGAIAEYKEARRLQPNFVYTHLYLGAALNAKGDVTGAGAAYKEALRLDPKNTYALALLPQVERMQALLLRLPDILAGKAEPRTPAEACDFAVLSAQPTQKRYAAALRLFENGFAANPILADDLVAAHRYNAACCAVRAAAGDGDAADVEPAERSALRHKALAWLRAELAVHRDRAESETAAVAAVMLSWQYDPQLTNVRDSGALARLPVNERASWRKLWADVAVVIPPRLPYDRPFNLALAGDWAEAAAAYAAALERVPTNDAARWFEYGCVLLLADDPDGYRKACADMLQRSGKPGMRSYSVARACTLAPDAVKDLTRPAKLAEKELRDSGSVYWSLTEQGALAYRGGRYAEAAGLLEKSLHGKLPADGAALSWAWLALAHQSLGQTDKAAAALTQAVKWLDRYPDRLIQRDRVAGVHPHNWMEAQILRREAESLIRKK